MRPLLAGPELAPTSTSRPHGSRPSQQTPRVRVRPAPPYEPAGPVVAAPHGLTTPTAIRPFPGSAPGARSPRSPRPRPAASPLRCPGCCSRWSIGVARSRTSATSCRRRSPTRSQPSSGTTPFGFRSRPEPGRQGPHRRRRRRRCRPGMCCGACTSRCAIPAPQKCSARMRGVGGPGRSRAASSVSRSGSVAPRTQAGDRWVEWNTGGSWWPSSSADG